MDAWSLLRMLGALMLVLGALVAVSWAVRRYDLTLPRKWLESLGNTAPDRRLKVVERLALDPRRSVVLLRRDDTEFSVMIGPEGVVVLETVAPAAAAVPAVVPAPQPAQDFTSRLPDLPEIRFAEGGATPFRVLRKPEIVPDA